MKLRILVAAEDIHPEGEYFMLDNPLIHRNMLKQGSQNVIKCLGVASNDRMFIIADREKSEIAECVAAVAGEHQALVKICYLEDYGDRPLTAFPETLRNELKDFEPTVTSYIAAARPGEITFRIALIPFLVKELKVRHGHMIGITPEIMVDGMCADYDRIFKLTHVVYEIVSKAKSIHVTSDKGSNITGTFSPDLKWIPCHGSYHQQGTWGNLPEGEVFTAPLSVDGIIVADVLGDYFSEKYGVLENPVKFQVQKGYITEITSENKALAQELKDYFWSTPNGNRAGEFAIGTLDSLTRLTGNLLQDEKMPGLHVAFGNPYPEFTGADWNARIHVDVIPTLCTVEVDGQVIMNNGKFTDEVLEMVEA